MTQLFGKLNALQAVAKFQTTGKAEILKKILSVVSAGAIAATALVLGVSPAANAAGTLKIAHIPKLGTIGYFQAADKGVQRARSEDHV